MERWSADESRALIALRERVERETSRSINAKAGNASDDDEEDGGAVDFGGKRMWEWVSTEMKKQGYHRSMVQCKAKWTVLFNRYKSMELSERQGKACPFFDELTVIFKIRAEQAARVAALGHGVVDTRPAGSAGARPAGLARAAAGGGSLFGSEGLFGMQGEDGEGEEGGEEEEEEEEEEEYDGEGEGDDGEEEGEGDAAGKKRKRGSKGGTAGGRGRRGSAGASAAGRGAGRTRVDSRGDAEKEGLRRKLGEGWLGMKVDKKRLDKMWEVQGELLKQHALLEGQWGDEGERVEERGKERGEAWIERLEEQEKRRLAEDVKWRCLGGAWIDRLEEQEKRRLAEDVKWREVVMGGAGCDVVREEERRAQKAEAREVECDAMLQVLLSQLQAQTYPTFV
ncbi:unnamed protein product [Closterium sp. NIES-65]|nr:unnamed protein product [Closterium sp. NIES-65]CAI5994361.1 unnamed protein product [Closterium sp. NIES-65]